MVEQEVGVRDMVEGEVATTAAMTVVRKGESEAAEVKEVKEEHMVVGVAARMAAERAVRAAVSKADAVVATWAEDLAAQEVEVGVAEHWVATAAARLVATWAEDLAAQEVEVGMAVALEEATVEVQEVRRVEAAAGLKEWAEVTLETVARVVVRPAVVAEARLVDLAAVTFAPNTRGAAR